MSSLRAMTLAIMLGLPALAAAQTPALDPPKEIFGTWLWNPTSRTAVDNYQCYIERVEDLGGGRTRVRDHRILLVKDDAPQVFRNDFDVLFNTPIMRADRTSTLWRVTGPRSYQLMTLTARGDLPTFIITRDISPDGQRMTQVGQGVINGINVKSTAIFDRAPEGTMRSGGCSIE